MTKGEKLINIITIIIIMSMFINRVEDLDKLQEIFSSNKAELVLLYGRRRIGKSRLLVEAIANKNALYFLADVSENVLDNLARQIPSPHIRFANWDDFFSYLVQSTYDIIVIDEFQYLYDVDKSWPTILQRWWETFKDTKKKIILCGSILSTIYRIAKGYGSALYGRKTREITIEPLNFQHIAGFYKKYSVAETLIAYFILGGIPRYLEEFDDTYSLHQNIKQKIIDKTSFLYNEPMNLLYEEFRDPTPYISIMLALTEGKTKFNEISDYSRITTNKLPKYLTTLERVRIIAKEYPITEKKLKSKITRYKLEDNFYKFWFTFIFNNKSRIELGLDKPVLTDVIKGLNSYCGHAFEETCKDFLLSSTIFALDKIGKWWYKDNEIDIVALHETTKEILFCECKWANNVNAEKIAKDLKRKSPLVDWNPTNRKESYAIFAKSFNKKVESVEGKKVHCFDLDDFEKLMKK